MTRARRNRRVRTRSVAWATLVTVVVVLFAILVPIHSALYGTHVAVSFVLGAAVCAAPLLAERRPRLAIALFCSGMFAFFLLVNPALATEAPWPWSVPATLLFILFVGVITFRRGPRIGAVPLAVGVALSLVVPFVRPEVVDTPATSSSTTADLIVTASIALGVYLIAALVAARVRVGEELAREREFRTLEQSRRALVEERTRIARELHDVVAHSMSLIQVQASTARYRVDDLSAGAVDEFDSIAASARGALGEMRRILGILRTDDHTAELAPQRGIDDIPALAESTRRAGARVDLVHEVHGDVSAATQIAAYRIVQESLSNALRHAPDSAISITVTADDASVSVLVRNAPHVASGGGGAGHGIRGMIERAELLGGELHAGADAGGWRVTARIPRHFDPALAEGAR